MRLLFLMLPVAVFAQHFPSAECYRCTANEEHITNYDVQVFRQSRTPCTYRCRAVTQSAINTVSVVVSGSGFSGSETSASDRVVFIQDLQVSSGDRFDVESGHGSGFSIGEGCRDCEQGRFHCETSTNAGTDCDGDGDGPGGTSDIPIPGLTGSVAHTTSGSDKARLWQPKRAMDDCISPILIDLEHDGFLFGGGENPVSFDMFGDGNPIVMNWVVPAGDDAFLVRDANGNGLADHGGELFGNGTWMMLEERFAPNGFVGLSQFDDPALGGNSDGLITDADEVWQSLMLWVDLDADGVCDVSEMLHLNEAGLARLETIPKSSRRRDRHGNLLKYTADAFRYEGPRLKMVDVFFQIH